MKIVMPIESENQKPVIAATFGRASDFIIYDTISALKTIIVNQASKKQGGAGIMAAQTALDHAAEAAIVPQCGENAMALFQQANVAVYQSSGNNIDENIHKFLKNELKLLSNIHPGMHQHP